MPSTRSSITVLAMTLFACAPSAKPAAPIGAPPRDVLARLATRTVLFGHQSVGGNILDGVARLAAAAGTGPRVPEAGAKPAPGVLAHVLLAANGDPARKIRSFAEAVDALGERAPEVALMKLCYVDFDAATDAAGIFELYRHTLAELEERHPRTAFVPVTVPLTTVQSGFKGALKRLLGKAPWGVRENARREEFNALVRLAWGPRVFDLARLEATRPDGTPEEAEWEGRRIPALAPEYTADGGHLNAAGQDRVAQALVAHLAAATAP